MNFAKLARRLRRPRDVQRFLRDIPYNRETQGDTLRSAASALAHNTAHCLEATFVAAAILEHRGYPPLVVSMESQDMLDHVIFAFQDGSKWGAIARSRDEGLHGRPPRFRSIRDLVRSYFDPFVDETGRITGYALANLDDAGADWRASPRNVWRVESYLLQLEHTNLPSSDARYRRLLKNYLARGPMPRLPFWW